MKRVTLLTLFTFAFLLKVQAQAPQGFNYQAVARDATGAFIKNTAVTVAISILDGGATGTVVYSESQSATTNAYGLFNVVIGRGNATQFAAIQWETGAKYIRVSVNGNAIGGAELLSVPYALYANKTAPGGNAGVTSITMGAGLKAGTITSTGTIDIDTAGAFWNAKRLVGIAIDPTPPTATNNVLVFKNGKWTPSAIAGGTGTTYAAGRGIAIDIANDPNIIRNTGDTDSTDDVKTTTVFAGEVTGTYDNLKVSQLIGFPLTTTIPPGTAKKILVFDGNLWNVEDLASGNTPYTAGAGIDIVNNTIINTGDTLSSDDVTLKNPVEGDMVYYTGGEWQKISYPNPIQKDSSLALKIGASGPFWGLDRIGAAGSGVSTINGKNEPNHEFLLDTNVAAVSVFPVSVGGGLVQHTIGIPIAGKTKHAGLLSLADYTAFKNGSGGATYTKGAGIAISSANQISAKYDSAGWNASKILGLLVDTTVSANSGGKKIGNVLTYNSAGKLVLSPVAGGGAQTLEYEPVNGLLTISGGNSVMIPSGGTYTKGKGIDLTGNVISAKTDSAGWNANKLLGIPLLGIPTAANNNNILKFQNGNWVLVRDSSTIKTSVGTCPNSTGIVTTAGTYNAGATVTISLERTTVDLSGTPYSFTKVDGSNGFSSTYDGMSSGHLLKIVGIDIGTTISLAAGEKLCYKDPHATTVADNWGNQVVATDTTLIGEGIATNPLRIKPAGNNTVLATDATGKLGWVAKSSIGSGGSVGTASASGGLLKNNANAFSVNVNKAVLDTIGGKLTFRNGTAVNQVLKWNGSAWTLRADSVGTGSAYTQAGGVGISGTNKIRARFDNTTIDTTAAGLLEVKALGIGTAQLANQTVTPAKLANGTAVNQVLKWNGSAWTLRADSVGTGTSYIKGTGILNLTGNRINVDSAKAIWNASKINGIGVETGTPAINQLLKYDGANWIFSDDNTGSASYTEGPGINITGSQITADSAKAIWNAGMIAGKAVVAVAPVAGNILKYDGTSWVLSSDNAVSGSASKPKIDNITIDTNGIGDLRVKALGVGATQLANQAVTPAKLANGTAVNQVLKWNGSAWTLRADSVGTGSAYTQAGGIGISGTNKIRARFDNITVDTTAAGLLEVKNFGIGGNQLANNAVTTAKIADFSVTLAKLTGGTAVNQVIKWNGTAWTLRADSVGTGSSYTQAGGIGISGSNKIYARYDNITIDTTATGLLEVKPLGIGTAQLAALSVTTAKIANANVTLAKLAAGTAVNQVIKWNGSAWTLRADSVGTGSSYTQAGGIGISGSNKIYARYDNVTIDTTAAGLLEVKALGIGTAQLAALSITTAKIAANAVDSTKVGPGALSATDINFVTTPVVNDVLTYTAAGWRPRSGGGSGWNLTGNALTDSITGANKFIGTTDNTPLIFKTNNLETMRITRKGNVSIGGAPAAGYSLAVYGKIKTANITESSDKRLKRDIKPIENALEKVKKLTGVTYKWRKDEFPEMKLEDGTDIGLIAQEVETVLPELVNTDEKGFKSIEYSHLVALLIEGMKEQQKQMDALKAELANKDTKAAQSEDRIKSLESSVNTLSSQMQLLMELVGSKEGVKASK